MSTRRASFQARESQFVERIEPNLHAILTRLTQGLSPAEAAREIESLNEPTYELTQTITDWASRQDFATHAVIVDLILEYYERKQDDRGGWMNFCWTKVDVAYSWGGHDDPYNEIPEEARQWERWWAFMALLSGTVSARKVTITDEPDWEGWPLLDFSSLAQMCLGFAFIHPDSKSKDKPIQSEHATRCACWWLIRDCDPIWERCKNEVRHEPRKTRRELPDWHFGLWHHWKQSVIDAQSRDFTDDTKSLLQRALAEMERCDSEDVIPESSGKWW